MAENLTEIGVISDTHGVLRAEAADALAGAQLIIHAGDVGRPEILDELRRIAPVVAVRGNVDYGDWADDLPMTACVEIGPFRVHVLHILTELDVDLAAKGYAGVIFGHSHKPEISQSGDVFHFNPGSAGPRRFKLPVTVGWLSLRDGRLHPRLIDIGS